MIHIMQSINIQYTSTSILKWKKEQKTKTKTKKKKKNINNLNNNNNITHTLTFSALRVIILCWTVSGSVCPFCLVILTVINLKFGGCANISNIRLVPLITQNREFNSVLRVRVHDSQTIASFQWLLFLHFQTERLLSVRIGNQWIIQIFPSIKIKNHGKALKNHFWSWSWLKAEEKWTKHFLVVVGVNTHY